MRKCLAVLLVAAAVAISACGGGSNSPAAPPPVTTPPTTLPSFSGTYIGSMLFNVAGQAEVRVTGRTTVTQNGNSLDFSALTISGGGIPSGTNYQLGNATLSGNTFVGTSAYQSSGCGLVNVTFNGHFAGTLMNLTQVLTPQSCANFRLVGELSR